MISSWQTNIQVPDELSEKFSEFSPLFIVGEVSEDQIPQHMKDYQERAGRKMIGRTEKRLGVTKAKRILLYMPMLRWYLSHGLKVTLIHNYLKYESGKPFNWFSKEVSKARRD